MEDIFADDKRALGSANCPVCGRFAAVIRTVRDDSPMSGEVPHYRLVVRCRQHGERETA